MADERLRMRTLVRVVLPALLLGAAYWAGTALAIRFTRFDGGVAFIWVANALLLPELLYGRRRRRPVALAACLAAVFSTTWLFGLGLRAAPVMAAINVGEAVLGAAVLRRVGAASPGHLTPRGLAAFFWACGLLVPGLLAVPAALVATLVSPVGFWSSWLHWMVAHGLGTVMFAPGVALFRSGRALAWARTSTRAERMEAVALLIGVAAVSLAVFAQSTLPLLFLPLLPVTLTSFRLGYPGAVGAIAILCVISAVATVCGLGPVHLVHGYVGLQADVLQFYLACAVILALPTAASLDQRRALLERLAESEARYRLVAEQSGDVILNIDPDGRLRYVSPSAATGFGLEPAAMIGRMAAAFVAREDVAAAIAIHAAAIADPARTHTAEYRIVAGGGVSVWCEAHMQAVLSPTGQVVGVVNSVRNVAQRKAMETRLRQEASSDPLTGLLNRRAFSAALTAEIATHAAGGPPACVAIFDIDHFKSVNDRFGHAAGDAALVEFARRAADTVRGNDVVARLGGEEFAVLLRRTDTQSAQAVCERLRQALARAPIRVEALSITITASAGLATLAPASSEASVLEAADRALYAAKHSGRDRLVLAA